MEDITKARARSRRWAAKNRKRVTANASKWRKANKERYAELQRVWRHNNPEKVLAIRQKSQRLRTAAENLRRARKLCATPKWLTKDHIEEMKRFYIQCPKGYHVDHIIPLQGKNICGLHVPWNLQILPASDNIRKGNRLVEGA